MTTPIPSEVIERELFEAEAGTYGLNLMRHELNNDDYYRVETQSAWHIWQLARREHSSKEVADVEPAIWIRKGCLGWALSGSANGIGQFSYIMRDGVDGYVVPMYAEPPSSHQAAASMKQKCLEILDTEIAITSPAGDLAHAANNACLKFIREKIQAIPTVEESK
jgi:hypothetical protein